MKNLSYFRDHESEHLPEDKSEKLTAKDSLIKTKETNKVIVIFLILAFGLLLSAIVNLGLMLSTWKLTTKEKIYVEGQGEVRIAYEKDPDFRSNEVIQETLLNWLYLTWEWEPSLPEKSNPDPGIRVKAENSNSYFKVPTRVYTASYLLEIGFRQKFLRDLSKIIPQNFYFGKLTSHLKIYHLSNAQRIARDRYKIDVVMTRTDVGEFFEREETKINRTIYLKTITPYRLVEGNGETLVFRKQLHHILKNGLLIEGIEPLKEK